MERVLSQGAHRRLAFLILLAILATVVANQTAFGEPSDKTKKPITTNREPSAGSNAAQATMAAQAPLLTAAERIKKLDSQGAGLGGIRLLVDKHTLEVWWKGEPPAAVREEIARQEHEHGIKVVLGPARYTHRELVETARAIMSKPGDHPGVVSVGPSADGSALEIGVIDTERAASLKFPVPVHIVLRRGVVPLFSRGADTPPWWAGGVTRPAVAVPSTCSTGFAMARGSSHGILTAEHCFCGGGVVFNNGVGVPIGPAELASTKALFTDSLFIDANSGARTYDGGVGVGEFSKPVVGTQSNFPGMGVCTSGAGTGVHCDIFIDSTDNAFCNGTSCPAGPCPGDPAETFIEGASFAHKADGTAATGNGDSGGPVFTLANDPSTVNAAGVMFGAFAGTETQCQGFGTTCFSTVVFTDVDSLKQSHNADVLVSGGSTSGGGATTISMLVFAAATFLWILAQLLLRRRRLGSSWQ